MLLYKNNPNRNRKQENTELQSGSLIVIYGTSIETKWEKLRNDMRNEKYFWKIEKYLDANMNGLNRKKFVSLNFKLCDIEKYFFIEACIFDSNLPFRYWQREIFNSQLDWSCDNYRHIR